jgi:hypothetical protein
VKGAATQELGVPEQRSQVSAANSTLAVSTPAVRVESGNPTPEELAALVVVLSALGVDDGDAPDMDRRSAWADPAWRLVGPSTRIGGWRASGLPH